MPLASYTTYAWCSVNPDGTAWFACALLPWEDSWLCSLDAATGAVKHSRGIYGPFEEKHGHPKPSGKALAGLFARAVVVLDAEGNVVGTIQGGREFEALWVAYDEEDGILYTDEPVLITDEDGSYRGGGFRYFIHQQRFRLMGGASIVQEP